MSSKEDKKKKEKKEKKEKESKSKDGEPGSPGSPTSKSKEKKEKKDKKDKESKSKDGDKDSKDSKVAGSTTYKRSKVSVDEGGKSKTKVLWIPEGHTASDKEVVWTEVKDPTGGVIFANLANSEKRTLELPDMGGAGGAMGEAPPKVQLEKKKFHERKEWKDEGEKKKVVASSKKALAAAQKDGVITKDEYTLMSSNIAKEYMSQFKKMDDAGETWIINKADESVQGFVDEKKKSTEAWETRRKERTCLTLALKKEDDLPLPPKPNFNSPKPLSQLVPRANYLRDPYYYRRLKLPNPRRTTMESKVEETIFLNPGSGTVKIMACTPVKLTTPQGQEQSRFACVARDWVGAFVLVFVDPPPEDIANATITGVYPLLEHVDFPETGYGNLTVSVDDISFQMTFPDQDSANYLSDALKMAMCAMYKEGKDDSLTITMRAYSLEFSSMELNYYPDGMVPDVKAATKIVLSEENKFGQHMDKEFFQLRLCMRTPEGRDTVLRDWVSSVEAGALTKRKGEAVVKNHLRVIEEAVRGPAYHEDQFLAQKLEFHLGKVRVDQPEEIRARIDYLRSMLMIIAPLLEKWRSREEMIDVSFQTCFNPVDNTDAAAQDASLLAQRKANYARDQVPPGIYLTLMCYCPHADGAVSVLTNQMGNLFSEVIISHPSEKELDNLNPSNPDFRWILAMAGATENWAQDVNTWGEVYDNAGRHTFRAQFIRAARQLLQSQYFPLLGFVFDTPIIQRPVSCAHILCCLKIDSKDRVPATAGEWMPMSKFESKAYIQAMTADRNSRIPYLPAGYHNCVRYAAAAIDQRNSLSKRMDAGFYLVHLVYTKDSQGMMMLVPEENRWTPPATLISYEVPTLEQWRWIQSLNERKRRTGGFGIEFNPSLGRQEMEQHLTFEQRFAKAMFELDQGVGIPIDKFYDLDMFTLDEGQGIRGVIAVHLLTSNAQITTNTVSNTTPAGTEGNNLRPSGVAGAPGGSMGNVTATYQHSLPRGTVPMVWKHADVVEATFYRMYWPAVYGAMLDERSAQYRRTVSSAQPFTMDEAYRLLPESSLLHYIDIDRYSFVASFFRQAQSWLISDGRSLVEKFGGDEDDAVARSIEDTVDLAASNYASVQDMNINTMKSCVVDAASSAHFSWSTMLSQIREYDKVIAGGYAQRLVTNVPDAKNQKNQIQRRTYDELYGDEESDDETDRPATVYHAECTLEELVYRDPGSEKAHKYFEMQEIVSDIVDIASIECVDVGNVREIGNIVTDMITIIETSEDLLDNATLLSLKQDTEAAAWTEREEFQKHWLDVFRNDTELLDHTQRRATVAGGGSDTQGGSGAAAGGQNPMQGAGPSVLDIANEEEVDEAFEPSLFYDGSAYSITSFSDGVRVCMAKAANSSYQLSQMLKVSNSTSEALELVQALQEYTMCVNRRDVLMGRNEGGGPVPVNTTAGGGGGTTPRGAGGIPGGGGAGAARKPGDQDSAAQVTLVSKEFVEFPIQTVDPLRCLALHGANGKVRFPTIITSSMEVLASHLQCSDFNVPHALKELRRDTATTEQLLEMALQMKAPLLTLWFATEAFGTKSGPSAFFTSSAALQLRTLVQDGFMFEYGIKDWLHVEVLGGESINAAMDVMWWIRFLKEASADQTAGDRRDAFSDHESSWKQVYAETRVRVFLSYGIHAVSREEVSLWTQSLGRYVEYLSLRDSSVSDAEINILSTTCPNLKSVDLSYTNISSKAIELLQQHCRGLVECNIMGCDLTAADQDAIRRHCTENRRRVTAPE